MLKKAISLLFALILFFGVVVSPVSALNAEPEIELQWNNVSTLSLLLVKEGEKIRLNVKILGESGTTLSNIRIGLYKMTKPDVGKIAEWTDFSPNINSLNFDQTVDVVPSGSYRLAVWFDAVNNGETESISQYSDKTF